MKSKKVKSTLSLIQALAAFLLLFGIAARQNDKLKGVINGRSGATMSVQTQGSGTVTVVLTDSTQVGV
jgi:hypothetical protein